VPALRAKEEIALPVNVQMVVELYSRERVARSCPGWREAGGLGAVGLLESGEGGIMITVMKDFQAPMRVEADKEALSPTYGKFTAEPFERGFGTTVGNSLRRVLLSSLTGAAVTTVRIEGVLHEFPTIPGGTEDVTATVLHVKTRRLQRHQHKR